MTICAIAGRPLVALVIITATSFASLLVRVVLVGATFRAGRRGVL